VDIVLSLCLENLVISTKKFFLIVQVIISFQFLAKTD